MRSPDVARTTCRRGARSRARQESPPALSMSAPGVMPGSPHPHPGDKALSPVPDGGPAAHGSQPRPPPGLSWTRGGDSREPTAPPCVSSAGSVQGCKTCPPRPASVWTALKGPPEASAAASSSAFTTQGHRSLRAWPRRCPSKVLGCEFLPLFTRVPIEAVPYSAEKGRGREAGREGVGALPTV